MSRPVVTLSQLLLLPLLLAGCWTGDAFYEPGDLRQPIAAGLYEVRTASDPSRATLRVDIVADGRMRVTASDGSSPGLLGIAALDPGRHRVTTWEDDGSDASPHGRYRYGLLEQEPDGDFLLIFPMCDPAAGRIAGVIVETFRIGGAICRFRDRSSLEAALRRSRLDERDPRLGIMRLHRIDHGAS
jgi:hypothetical protein